MENKICPFCNAEVDVSAKKCKFCGEWISNEENSLPPEIRRFNWGAFLLNWIWGIFHKKYITLLYFPACLIPILGPLAISVWFGIAGNKWAWKSNCWETIESFNESQRVWVRIWLILFILGLIFAIKTFLILAIIGNAQI